MAISVQEHYPLDALNTLAVSAQARFYVHVQSLEQVREACRWAEERALPVLVLGGGSNLLLTGDFPGLVLHLGLKGIEYSESDGDECLVRVQAGENWHQLVVTTVQKGLRGLENLALIPGTVGAAPVQNIGAYGVEVKDVIVWVETYDPQMDRIQRLSPADCQFDYRHSLFKTAAGKHLIILSVGFRLSRSGPLQTQYKDLQLALEDCLEPTALDVMQAVIRVRQAKLPDPAEIPNAGSFFKNPIVDCRQFAELEKQFPGIAHYPSAEGRVKLAAAWLIDQAGWKGVIKGPVGVHSRQALVLINPGRGRGEQVIELASQIQESVKSRYGVELEIEPVIV